MLEEVTLLAGVCILRVDKGELAEVTDDVLHLGVVGGARLTAEVVKGWDAVKEVVDDGDDDGDTDGVAPDNHNGDNVDPSVLALVVGGVWVGRDWVTRHPAEDTEDGSEGVDTEDGTDELPVGEGLATTSDEDQPVFSKGNLEEEDFLNGTEVLDDTTVWHEESTTDDPGTEGKQYTEDDGDDPDLWQLPLDWALLGVGVVVGDGDGGQVSEQGKEDNQVDDNGLVDDDHGGDKVDFQVQAEGDTVLDVSLHALEDLASSLDGEDDGGETRSKEDNIGGGLSSLGRTLDSDTTVGLLEGRSVVDTVTSHSGQVTTLLKHLDDLVLVLGEDLGETVGALDKIVLHGTGKTTVDKLGRVVDLGTQGKHLASLLCDGNSVTSKHFNRNTKLLSLDDGLGGVLTWRVEHGKHTEEDPWLVVLLVGDTEGAETTASELGSLVTEEIGGILVAVGQGENGLGGTLGASVAVTTERADSGNTLRDRVERSELLSLPVILEDLTGLGVALEGEDGDLVDGVEGLQVVGRGKSSDSHHPVDILALGDERLTDRELVGSEGTGLVGAEDVDTGEGLNGGELLDDSLLLGEVGGTDGESGGGDDGKTDRDTDDEEDKGVVEKVDGRVLWGRDLQMAEETTDPGEQDPEDDKDEKRSSDGVHDGLEVTLVLGALDESSGATDERVLGGGEGNSVGLAALATGGVVDDIAHVLVDGERLAGDGRLVTSDDGVALVEDTLLALLAFLVLRASWVLLWVQLVLLTELLVGSKVFWGVVVANETGVGGNSRTFLDDDLKLVSGCHEAIVEAKNLQCHLGQAHGRGCSAPGHHGHR